MKHFFGWLCLLCLIACNEKTAQKTPRPRLLPKDSVITPAPVNPYADVDVSPMDMTYLPVDYPKLTVRQNSPIARIIYSRPHKQGRKIFDALIKYGEPWRLGANEATELECFQAISIQGKKINPGKYVLYCIPMENKWTIALNKNLYSWGLNIDPSKDIHRFDVPVQKRARSVEYFSMVFQNTNNGADLVIAWDDIEIRLPVQFTQP